MPAQLKPNGAERLRDALREVAETLPGTYLSIATPDSIIFDECYGQFDMLEKGDGARAVSTDDVNWFASTSKLITSVCYLQLVDRGILTLDTDMTTLFGPLKAATANILQDVDLDTRQPKFTPNTRPVTLRMMLNQSSGFGKEFGDVIPKWKQITDKGKGFVNSCKIENLIHTPITFEPGSRFEYGNSAEWLGLMLPQIAGVDSYELYLQNNICGPLGLKSTTWMPFGPDYEDRLRPLRYARGGERSGPYTWEELNGQLDLLTLPRKREEVEYPVGGGGIYSSTSDYVKLLQHLLRHFLALTPSSHVTRPETPLLSDASVASLWQNSLPDAALPTIAAQVSQYLGNVASYHAGEAGWTTGMALYHPGEENASKRAWGRRPGSVGWGGAAGTEYWIDVETGIACVWTTQMLPASSPGPVRDAKSKVERAIYEAIEVV